MSHATTVTPEQIELIKDTWSQVVPIADTASKLFYDRLFQVSPHIAPMFDGVDMPAQRQKLVQAINMVVVSLEKIDTLLPVIRDLGKRHVGYGVEAAHYDDVGAALLWTLGTGLGEAWTVEAKTAWSNAYGLLASVMLEGADNGSRDAA